MPRFSRVLQHIRHSVHYPSGPRSSSLLLTARHIASLARDEAAHPQPKEATGKRDLSLQPPSLCHGLSPQLTHTVCPSTDQKPAAQGSCSTHLLPSKGSQMLHS